VCVCVCGVCACVCARARLRSSYSLSLSFKSRSVDILASVGALPVFDHMLQVVMQVSYASVFAMAFPAGSSICLIIIFFQARILASRVLITGARHILSPSNGIGMWLHTLEVVFFISVAPPARITTAFL